MNIKMTMSALQNIIITLLVQAAMVLIVWNIVVPTLDIAIINSINYGQALLLIILVRLFRYEPLALGSHQSIALIAKLKEFEFIRQQQLDQMIFDHQQKMEERSDARSPSSIKVD